MKLLGLSLVLAGASSVLASSGVRPPRLFKDVRGRAAVGRRVDSPAIEARAMGSSISFSNPKTNDFLVDGTKIPDVDFDVGPSWAGLMPISSNVNETRKLFFWFWPTTNAQYTNDLVFWTNGGPGCSSLEGLLQENGPFVWPTGTAKPIPNQWAWTNLSHVLWVEQPVGTGFSTGVPNITNEDELAAQFAGFLTQFLEVFSELKGKNFYAAGESYAGFYVPYIANYLYTHPKAVDLNLKGIWITDPSVSYDIVTEEIPALTFAQKWQNVLALNSTFMAQLKKNGDACGYTDYYKKYATYPPKGILPLPKQAYRGTPNIQNINPECYLWSQVYQAAITVNPNFNVYRIFDVWPVLWDVLGFPGSFNNQQSPLYFNRSEVQDAIHAPHINWAECSAIDVFVNGMDRSVPTMLSVMPNVIEKSERTVVMHGGIDFVLIAEGTKIAIQNMTWGGKQGFQKPIQPESFVIEGFGVLGSMHQERKLTYVEVDLAGHMMPQYAPWAAYKTMSFLLGRENLTDHENDGALYPSNYELFGPGPRRASGLGRRGEL
ncbi:Serine carboxypeptidase [Ceratobasidium sp. AG-Ba]|nr:Serine carboxypeptidase [Ceratobasidium sp. AG-Ba]QRW08959.1 Serine carboxypeptidase [Ceratobasidium sp. AG-Ba]